MSERQNLQDLFLNNLRKEHTPVSVFLVNGIKLVGRIESFDQYMVLLRGHDQAVQAIFKHAISTVSPARPGVPHSHSGPREPREGGREHYPRSASPRYSQNDPESN